ncbi:MAG: UvrD-helicase domain-containing protein [Pseudomonadota bacterium]
MQLSPQQAAAVSHSGSPALVVAGAGSGKTRTLTAKIVHLVREGYDPTRLLAITFTNKAADEMKRRLMEATGYGIERFPWVRTYHSACLQILKRHCQLLGFTPPLQVFAVYQQQKLLRDVLVDRLNVDKKHVRGVLSEISSAKNSADPAGYFDQRPRVATIRLADAYRLYEQALKENNAVDFDNILLLTRDILDAHGDIRERYRKQFQYLLVDEYQDTNNLQEELTRLLTRDGRLFCVGDDWQAIYSFRGSNVDHFLKFAQTYPDAKLFRLEQNYRSADEIVRLANTIIGHNTTRMDKTCFSDMRGGTVELHDFFNDDEEAQWVARKARTLQGMGVPLGQMVVLYRTKFSSLSFERAFRAAGIPYRMLGGKGFFERMEVMDLNCYLSAAAFPRDDASFERIINTPRRGIGPGTVRKLLDMRTEGMSLQEAAREALRRKLLTQKLYSALETMMQLLDDIRAMSPGDALRAVIQRVDYMAHLTGHARGNSMEVTSREENIEQLIYAASQKQSLYDYLEEAALIREDREGDDADDGAGINLATIHAAKGLEFAAVFVIGCEENLFPHWRSLETPHGLEEERRLMYVSVTRAERYLYLSSASFRKGQYATRSRFLDEIAAEL